MPRVASLNSVDAGEFFKFIYLLFFNRLIPSRIKKKNLEFQFICHPVLNER